MTKISRNFTAGKMNKVVDQRILPEGEYIDAMNVRMGSTENSEIGVIENTKGNIQLSQLRYIDGTPLSIQAKCIGAIEDSANETIYWFVVDRNFGIDEYGFPYKLDMIVSFNIQTKTTTYHVISIGLTQLNVLNFDEANLITGINLINDLLFFTDNINPPRVININRKYPIPIGYTEQITAEELLVIKKPPVEAPEIELIKTAASSNYLDTRFICFAYRYKYADGEYSATSQWSAPAFSPNQFNYSIDSLLNEGMVNFFNAAKIKYNSGSSLVVGIDLLFKQSNNNIIKVIEKIDKADLGDDQIYEYVFSNSKIFTILPESEILRLYDNVPRFAKAQTIMGNRMMYGNYIEGYDLVDLNSQPVNFDYYTSLISDPIGVTDLPTTLSNGLYLFPNRFDGGNTNIPDSVINVDLEGVDLVEGASITISFTFSHYSFQGNSGGPSYGDPTQTTENIKVSFTFVLPTTYASVYEMATSSQFITAIGYSTLVYSNIQPMATACDGTTFTDQINCLTPTTLVNSTTSTTYTKIYSTVYPTITSSNQGLQIISYPGNNTISIQLLTTFYTRTSGSAPYNTIQEYYSIVFNEATYQKIASPKSLHSNRGYEIGIVYMDDYNRATTALVSKNNTEHIPCGLSAYQNSIQVTIPVTQIPPYWATRYKFVIKPDEEDYETIYSNMYFVSKTTNMAYFLLEGENARKVEEGDRFIVKRDSEGPTTSCVYATVLEKIAQQSGFIETVSGATPPAGVYMKINPNSFSVIEDANSIIRYGEQGEYTDDAGSCPVFSYPMSYPNPVSGLYVDYTVPGGSKIVMNIRFERGGRGCSCEKRIYTLDKTFIASANYDNMEDWFIGDNIESILNDGNWDGSCDAPRPNNVFQSGHGYPSCDLDTNYYRFDRDGSNRLYFRGSGTWSCSGAGSSGRRSYAYATFTVYRADNLFIFETEPADALPDVFYENELSFAITGGNHEGNVQNQNILGNIPAIVNTGFFNCFSFGNGAESYKIRDSIVGRPFNLGQRVTSVSAQDYKEAHRFSDITYSGIYNPESNVNKLNEFNLALLNFKHLESSFGDIYILDGRETDVLVLQEDKISYVLAGKNLLSDAAAGGAITSVPEVLGTQIARTEKYGISFNPESYVQWGYDRFFTDAKRGAVIQLRGDSMAQDQLNVISEANMRTWFRDEFNNSFNTQKLGGFDPYMNEYVLSSNDRYIPAKIQCLACGVVQQLLIDGGTNFCVNMGSNVGNVIISYEVPEVLDSPFFINLTGAIETTIADTESGSATVYKGNILDSILNVDIGYSGVTPMTLTISCPQPEILNIVQVAVTNGSDAGQTIHGEYRYTNGLYVSPTQSNLITFASGTDNPLVSYYNITSGAVGSGAFPPEGSILTLQTNKIPPDTFDFNLALDKLRYLRSNVLYANNTIDITNLLSESNIISPIVQPGAITYGEFTVPISTEGEYLYLIYDFRKSYPIALCFSEIGKGDVWCNCSEDILGSYYINAPTFASATTLYNDIEMLNCAPSGWYTDGTIIRRQFGCVLYPQESLPDCGCACPPTNEYGFYPIDPTNYNGIWKAKISTGGNTGAIIIKFNSAGIPDGILATFGINSYNKLSSPVWGVLQSSIPGTATYVGQGGASTEEQCVDWYPDGGTSDPQPIYNYNCSSFINSGTTETVTVATGQIQVTETEPQTCVMVIPCPTATDDVVNLTFFAICFNSNWSASAYCPTALPGFLANSTEDCYGEPNITLYFAKVHTAADAYVGLYDFIFLDENGQFPASDGTYYTTNLPAPYDTIIIENGVVVDIQNTCELNN